MVSAESQVSCSFQVAEDFSRFLQVSLGAALFGRFVEPQEQKLEKGYHGCCAALHQILYLYRDHQKKMEFCYRFERGLHGCHKCVLQFKERVVKKARVAFEITLKLIIL